MIIKPKLPPMAGYVEVVDENGNHIYKPTAATMQTQAAAAQMDAVKMLSSLTLSKDDTALVQNDEQRLAMKDLYPVYVYGESVAANYCRQYEDKLYKCRQAHVTEQGWEPPLTPALWAVINKANAGTIDDPIPASRGMEYEYGKYYLDPEDNKVYLCERGSETGTIVLQYLPHELVGNYFTAVEVG